VGDYWLFFSGSPFESQTEHYTRKKFIFQRKKRSLRISNSKIAVGEKEEVQRGEKNLE